MKKLLLLSGILLGTLPVFAQDYVSFPTANAVWSERLGNSERPKLQVHGLRDKEVLIDGITYHELYRSEKVNLSVADAVGGLREADKRIYFYDYTKGKERLLYDFNLGVGDEFLFDGETIPTKVIGVATINIDGTDRRKIIFATGFGSWIEGIGNAQNGGLLGNTVRKPTCDCGTDLVCFRQETSWKYHNDYFTSVDCDGLNLAIGDLSASKATVSLYPNPITGTSYIHVAHTPATQVSIYSMTGALVKTYQVVDGADIRIRSNEFANGLYSYRVHAASGEALQKGLFEVRN